MIKAGRFYRERIIQLLRSESKQTDSYLFVNFKGLNASQLNVLRALLKEKKARLIVSKNRLLKKAFDNREENFEQFLKAETGIVYAVGDIVEITKALFDFNKENNQFEIKGGLINQEKFERKTLENISKLPTRSALLGMTVNCIASPLTSFVSALNQIILKFIWAIEEIKKKKG